MDCSQPGLFVHGILQATMLEWAAMPCSRGSSWTGDQTHNSCISCIGRWVLYHKCHLGTVSKPALHPKPELVALHRILWAPYLNHSRSCQVYSLRLVEKNFPSYVLGKGSPKNSKSVPFQNGILRERSPYPRFHIFHPVTSRAGLVGLALPDYPREIMLKWSQRVSAPSVPEEKTQFQHTTSSGKTKNFSQSWKSTPTQVFGTKWVQKCRWWSCWKNFML